MQQGSFTLNLVTRGRMFMNFLGLRNEKVFAIGFNKCGTTSLHTLFTSLGRPSFHGEEWRSCEESKILQIHDCFSDGIPSNLEKLDKMYPNSQYILQLRDLESWVFSRLKHIAREKQLNTHRPHSEWDDNLDAVKSWIVKRNKYHLFVLSYFSDRDKDLLLVNFIRDRDAATKVCRFLGHEGDFDRPDRNKSKENSVIDSHRQLLRQACRELGVPDNEAAYDIYCPSLASAEERESYLCDSGNLTRVFPAHQSSN